MQLYGGWRCLENTIISCRKSNNSSLKKDEETTNRFKQPTTQHRRTNKMQIQSLNSSDAVLYNLNKAPTQKSNTV